jgi:predicted secreted protein
VTFTTSILVYVMIWVVVLFMVLPWGVRLADKPEPGHATSAPMHPYIGLKLLITSVISLFVWVIAYIILTK